MTSLAWFGGAPRAVRGSLCLASAAVVLGGTLTSTPARAICRVVESEEDAPVAFDAMTSAFFVVVDDVIIDYTCPEDGDPVRHLSERARSQAGDVVDRVVSVSSLAPFAPIGHTSPSYVGVDAGAPDAGGFVRLCRDGREAEAVHSPLVSLVIQPRILEGGGHAGLVMPVAARPDVALGPSNAFAELAAMSVTHSERVRETVIVTEDASLGFQCTDPHYSTQAPSRPGLVEDALALAALAPLSVYGCGASGDGSSYYRPGTGSRDTRQIDYGDDGSVSVETVPVSDAYSVTALSASSLEALVRWMDDNGFAHDETDDAAFSAYVGEGRWFVALDVHPPEDPASTELGVTGLAPLVVSWPGSEVPIQNRLQFDPDGGTVVTDAFVLATARVDAEDQSALTISAGHADLSASALSSFGLASGVVTRLRLARQQQDELEDSRIVPIVGVASPPPMQDVERTTRVRIPLACCQGGGVASRSAPTRTFTYQRTYARADGMPPIPQAWFHTPEHDGSQPFCSVSRSDYGGGLFCAAASAPVSGFGPIGLAIGLLTLRARRRRAAQRS